VRFIFPVVLIANLLSGAVAQAQDDSQETESSAVVGTARITKQLAGEDVLRILVVDADGNNVGDFRVLQGVGSESITAEYEKRTGRKVVNWQPHTVTVGANGEYNWPLERTYSIAYLRVEADGYEPQVAGPIKKADGAQLVEFQLKRDAGIVGRVLTPEGQPAAEATVALALAQKDAALEDGRLRGADQPIPDKPSDRWRRPLVVKTDGQGNFELPTECEPAAVLVIHDSGVLETAYEKFQKNPELKLNRWGKIEGRVLWKDKPGVDDEITLSVHREDYGYPGMIASYAKTRSDREGIFTFERALPGHTQISRPFKPKNSKDGITQVILPSQYTHVTVKSGEPTKLLIGGQGRVVKGKLKGRDSWKDVTFHLHPTAPHIGLPGDDAMWKAWSELAKSEVGPLLFRSKQPVKADGTFEIHDMLPGSYQLFISAPGVDNYAAYTHLTVDAEIPGEVPATLDLGEIAVKGQIAAQTQ
jgi:hypothetical protein